MLLELGQVVSDLEPRRLRAYEDVLRRLHARRVDERAQRDVHKFAVADDGVEQRAAGRTARVVQGVPAVDELELLPLAPEERLERRARRCATARAVAVRAVEELVRDAVPDRAAFALSRESVVHSSSFVMGPTGRPRRTAAIS